jgi:hypothetical protein
MHTELSDKNFKENIGPISDISTLLELVPCQFTLKGGSKLQFGFVAQDVEKTSFKNLVYQNNAGVKSLAYTQLVAVLVAHIQSLTKRVNELEGNCNRRNL